MLRENKHQDHDNLALRQQFGGPWAGHVPRRDATLIMLFIRENRCACAAKVRLGIGADLARRRAGIGARHLTGIPVIDHAALSKCCGEVSCVGTRRGSCSSAAVCVVEAK